MKRKEKEIQNVVGGEGDENVDVKTKEEWFGKQIKKEEEACSREKENKNKQRKR